MMKHKNLLYEVSFDGIILSYNTTTFSKPVFKVLGFNHYLEIPVSIILGYRKKRVMFGFTQLSLTIAHYGIGKQLTKPRKLYPIVLSNEVLGRVETAINRLEEFNRPSASVSLGLTVKEEHGNCRNRRKERLGKSVDGDVEIETDFTPEWTNIYPVD